MSRAMAIAWASASLSGFFFNDTATTEIYTLSLHDALPIYPRLEKPSWVATVTQPFDLSAEFLPSSRPSIEATPSNHFPLVVESEHFDHTSATDTSIQNPNRVDSNMHINQLKLNRRNSCQADCP